MKKLGIDQVWIALPLRAEPRVRDLVQDLSPLNVEVCFVPDIFGFRLLNHSIAESWWPAGDQAHREPALWERRAC